MSENDTERDDDEHFLVYKRVRGAYHGRDITVRYGTMPCVMCGAHTTCLAFDSSEGEYGPVRVCQPCMGRLWPQTATIRL